MTTVRIQNLTRESIWDCAEVLTESDDTLIVRTDQMLYYGDAAALELRDCLVLATVIWVPPGKSQRVVLKIEHVLNTPLSSVDTATSVGG